MVLWRISQFHDLSGRDGLMFSARWHFAGTPVVYLAESPAGALLEICANTAVDDIPPSFTLLKIAGANVGSDIAIEETTLADLPQGWAVALDVTRRIGAAWLKSGRSAVLRVPSALVPETANYLLNPLHPDAGLFQIEHSYGYPFICD
jgi:RES domain-containing protein